MTFKLFLVREPPLSSLLKVGEGRGREERSRDGEGEVGKERKE